jgi:hypothetical protein
MSRLFKIPDNYEIDVIVDDSLFTSFGNMWRVTEPYRVGDIVNYNGTLYKANENITGGAIPPSNPTKWILWYSVTRAHTQTVASVIGLQTSLDGKANSSHTQASSTITGLQTLLDGKSATSHTHPYIPFGVYGRLWYVYPDTPEAGDLYIYNGNVQRYVNGDWRNLKYTCLTKRYGMSPYGSGTYGSTS